MDEIQYYEMQEQNAIGEVIAACAKKIFNQYDADTMAQLQRSLYKHTDAGIAISFELHEGYPGNRLVYCGDKRADTIKEPWTCIRRIGVSSIIEGSDAEIPLTWIDLAQYANDSEYEGDIDQLAIIAFNDFDALCTEVDEQACDLWHEAND